MVFPSTLTAHPRQTYLRWHLLGDHRQWVPKGDPLPRQHRVRGELFRTDELLGLEFLINGIPEEHREAAGKLLTPQSFFYGLPGQPPNWPGMRLYIPVGVRPTPGTKHGGSRVRYGELTELLVDLESCGLTHGVLLLGQSGGGKTTAAIKAANDCCFCDPRWGGLGSSHSGSTERTVASESRPSEGEPHDAIPSPQIGGSTPRPAAERPQNAPPLNGFLPVRLRADMDHLPVHKVLEHLLLHAAGFSSGQNDNADRVTTYLRWGPKLLIFCDLNAVPQRNRDAVVKALRGLQKGVGDRQSSGYPRHRVVISYRSTRQDDSHIGDLLQDELFKSYEVQQLDINQACAYIENLRCVERYVYQTLGITPPVRDVDRESKKLQEFTKRFTRNGQSLISVPLLMHFVSILSGEELDCVESIADLYDHVVSRMLRYHIDTYRENVPELLKKSYGGDVIRAMMTRVALAILGRGSDQVRIDLKTCRQLFVEPEQFATTEPLWPPSSGPYASFWRTDRSLYYRNFERFMSRDWLTEDEENAFLEFSLLRREGESVGFLHDSFLYYFAGVQALWNWGAPDLAPGPGNHAGRWYDAVVARVQSRPETWRLPFEFLASRMSSNQALALAERIITAEPHNGLAALLLTIIRSCHGRGGTDADRILQRIEWALKKFGSWSHRNPDSLMETTYNELAFDGAYPDLVGNFARTRIRKRILKSTRPWLEAVSAHPRSTVLTMSEHKDYITDLAAFVDGRIVSSSNDGTVKLWNYSSGHVLTMTHHTAEVHAIATTANGRVISVSSDATALIWDPDSGEVLKACGHSDTIRCVALLPNGQFVTGSDDHTIRLWDLFSGGVVAVREQPDAISVIAALPDGRIAYNGSKGTVTVWDPIQDRVTSRLMHTAPITSLIALANGYVVSGCGDVLFDEDGPPDYIVKAWHPDSGSVRTMSAHCGSILDITALRDGRVASASGDGTVNVWSIDGNDIVTMPSCNEEVHCVAELASGQVVSGSLGGDIVRVWTIGTDEVLEMKEHTGTVLAVVGMPDGCAASASCDNTVKVWDTSLPLGESITFHHDGAVRAVHFMPDGRLISAGADGRVNVWNMKTGIRDMQKQFAAPISAIDVLDDKRVIVSSQDIMNANGFVALWHLRSNAVRIARNKRGAGHVVMVNDGVVAWGGGDIFGKQCYLELWDEKADVVIAKKRVGRLVTAIGVLSSGLFLIGSDEGTITIWNRKGRKTVEIKAHSNAVTAFLQLDEATFLSASTDHAVKEWKLGVLEGRVVHESVGYIHDLGRINEGIVVSCGSDGDVSAIDHKRGVVVCRYRAECAALCVTRHNSDGRIGVGLENGGVVVLEMHT